MHSFRMELVMLCDSTYFELKLDSRMSEVETELQGHLT